MIEYNSSQSIKIKTLYLFLYILEIGITNYYCVDLFFRVSTRNRSFMLHV